MSHALDKEPLGLKLRPGEESQVEKEAALYVIKELL